MDEDDAKEEEEDCCESAGPCWPVTLGEETVVFMGGRLVVLSGVAVEEFDPVTLPEWDGAKQASLIKKNCPLYHDTLHAHAPGELF